MAERGDVEDELREDWTLPASLNWLRGSEVGRAWLEALPRLVAECAARWELRLDEPFPDAYVSLSVAARLPNGDDVVLKVQFPDRESEHEADALEHWDGDGAIRLLARDPERHALLLERCIPGRPVSELGQTAALDVSARLWSLAQAVAWCFDGEYLEQHVQTARWLWQA